MTYPKSWEKVTCSAWCEDENKIWLCLGNKNAICEINKKGKTVRILGSFPHNRLEERDLSLSVEKNGDYVVICPFRANDIAILKISTGELEFIELRYYMDKNQYEGFETEKFYRMISYKNSILFLGTRVPTIMRLNLITKSLDFFSSWQCKIEQHKCKEGVFFTDGYAQKENEIYLPLGRCSGILKVNLDTMEFDYIELGLATHGILGMTQQKNYVWLTEQDAKAGKFFQWNLDSNHVVQIDLPSHDAFYAPLYYKESLLFFRNYGKRSYQYELKTGKWRDITDRVPETACPSDKKVREDEIVYFSKTGKFYHWNPQTDISYFDEFKIEDNVFLETSWVNYWKKCKRDGGVESEMPLRDYIEGIKSFGEDDLNFFEEKENPIGEQILKLLKTRER
ncbi:MAG: hypothetical protein HFH87_01240 [Lachnospiraceae bacterium]|nr:hypothetical protein [Lachnospiraceae bacterium]